jgi:hypothetical protein
MLNTMFVAAVLEGIEGTLQELIGRVGRGDLRDRLATLQDETATLRRLLEEPATSGVEGCETAASGGAPWTAA